MRRLRAVLLPATLLVAACSAGPTVIDGQRLGPPARCVCLDQIAVALDTFDARQSGHPPVVTCSTYGCAAPLEP